jgi:hypothetical protein
MLFCGWEQRVLPLISQTTSKLIFPFVCPQKDEKQIFLNKHLDDQLWLSITHLFQLFWPCLLRQGYCV